MRLDRRLESDLRIIDYDCATHFWQKCTQPGRRQKLGWRIVDERMKARVFLAVLGVGLLATTGTVLGHHAFSAEFDAAQPIVLKGTVSKTEWVNPHSWIYLDVRDDTGKIHTWAIECGAPSSLLRRGWDRSLLPLGIEIVVDGFRAKNGSMTANAKDIRFADGRKLFVGSSGTGAPYDDRET